MKRFDSKPPSYGVRRTPYAVGQRLASVLVLGLAAAPVAGLPQSGFPAGAVTVSLDRVIVSERDLGRANLFRRLTGRRADDLFERPYGVAWDGDDLLVTDPGGARVLRLGKKRRVGRTPQNLLESPIGIAVCSQGIVVSDSIAGKVVVLDSRLHLKRWLAEGGLVRPTGVACQRERIFVVETGRHRVLAFEPAAREEGDDGGSSFVPLADGEVVVPGDVRVRALGRRGTADGEFNFPTTITLGADSLWVGDTLNFRLQRFDLASGAFVAGFGRLGDTAGEMPRVKGLAIDGSGRLWVTDAYLDELAVYAAGGTFLAALGRRGSEPGELSFPAGISIHADGRIAVADSFNRRLQVFLPAAVEADEEKR